jgi:hypothetical protein
MFFPQFSVLCSPVVGRSEIVGWDEYFVFVVVRKLLTYCFCFLDFSGCGPFGTISAWW